MSAVPEGEAGSGSLVPAAKSVPRRYVRHQVPDDILNNRALSDAVSVLPVNYNFEIQKTIWRIRQADARRVALQFPEGLMMYACTIADILQRFADIQDCLIMGDVTYGACCVDDFSAAALDADLLVHYGHSCLVPVDMTSHVACIYIFVDIKIDVDHLLKTIRKNFSPHQHLALAGTIQFASAVQRAKSSLQNDSLSVQVPQSRPLSPGEVLGCTAPVLIDSVDAIVFVADGRFHLEAIMIANPEIPAYRYDPYARIMTQETYDHAGMLAARRSAIERAASCSSWGLILGTLGRQGNPRLLSTLQAAIREHHCSRTCVLVLLSEVSPAKLKMMEHVEVWVQIACPRLTIDWGEAFDKPTLTPYEAMVALGKVGRFWDQPRDASSLKSRYPMDYYATAGGPWKSTWNQENRASK